MSDVASRPARAEEIPAVAELRWRWLAENRDVPVVGHDEFLRAFVACAAAQPAPSCTVAVRGEEVIGMAWLAVVARVPSPTPLERASGDVQSVYLVPHERNRGIGTRLLRAVLARADELDLDHVTVHSSGAAVTAYQRVGFGQEATYLRRVLGAGQG